MNTFEFLRPGVSKQLSPKCLCGTVFSLSRSLSPFFTRSSFSHSLYHAIICHFTSVFVFLSYSPLPTLFYFLKQFSTSHSIPLQTRCVRTFSFSFVSLFIFSFLSLTHFSLSPHLPYRCLSFLSPSFYILYLSFSD